MTKTTLIIGATSSLAYALCQQLAHKKHNLIITGRDKEELEHLANDLTIRHNTMVRAALLDLDSKTFNIKKIAQTLGDPDDIIMVAGTMGKNNSDDTDNLSRIIHVNYTAPAQLITHYAHTMETKGTGTIAIISSVSGDRGRQSNYLYGSAKAALTAFASGLRNRLSHSGVHVMTVKPGFIDTPLTYSMDSPLMCSREKAAKIIIRAMGRKKDVIYVPFFWCYIMMIIRNIPERFFKKLRL